MSESHLRKSSEHQEPGTSRESDVYPANAIESYKPSRLLGPKPVVAATGWIDDGLDSLKSNSFREIENDNAILVQCYVMPFIVNMWMVHRKTIERLEVKS
jgi:hypothetical protein